MSKKFFFKLFIVAFALSCSNKIETLNLKEMKYKEVIEYLLEGDPFDINDIDNRKISKISHFDSTGLLKKESRYHYQPFKEMTKELVSVETKTESDTLSTMIYTSKSGGYENIVKSQYREAGKSHLLKTEYFQKNQGRIEAIKRCSFFYNGDKIEKEECENLILNNKLISLYKYDTKDRVSQKTYFQDTQLNPVMEEIFDYFEGGDLKSITLFNIQHSEKQKMRTLIYEYKR